MAGTQPAHEAQVMRSAWWLYAGALALACGVIVALAVRWMGNQQAVDTGPDPWEEATAARASAVARGIQTVMGQGRPDLAAVLVGSHPDIVVVRDSGDRAFVSGDLSTYRHAIDKACQSPSGVSKQWIRSRADGNLAWIGSSLCTEAVPPNAVAPSKPSLGGDLSTALSSDATTWGESTRYLSMPIKTNERCTGCHNPTRDDGVLAWVVASGPPRTAAQAAQPGTRLVASLAGGATAAFILLLAAIMRRRRPR